MADDAKTGNPVLKDQAQTYSGFLWMTKWGIIGVILVLLGLLVVYNS